MECLFFLFGLNPHSLPGFIALHQNPLQYVFALSDVLDDACPDITRYLAAMEVRMVIFLFVIIAYFYFYVLSFFWSFYSCCARLLSGGPVRDVFQLDGARASSALGEAAGRAASLGPLRRRPARGISCCPLFLFSFFLFSLFSNFIFGIHVRVIVVLVVLIARPACSMLVYALPH
jgi:hypothetical protein